MIWNGYPAGIYLFEVNKRNTGTMCEICSKLTIKITDKTSMGSLFSLLLTLNKFHTLLWCFCCWIWTSKCLLGNEQRILIESATAHFMSIPLHPLKTSEKHRPSHRLVAWNELNSAADNLQKQPPDKFYRKKVALYDLAIFTTKHLCWSLILIKLQAWRSASIIKSDSKTPILYHCYWIQKMY